MSIEILHTVAEEFASYLSAVTDDDLKQPTPCAGWSVGDLYEHVIEENGKFGHAVSGLPIPQGATAGHGGLEDVYRESARYIEQAFAANEDPAQLREVAGVPGARRVAELLMMQIADTVIHTWDLTQGLGLEYEPRPEIAELVLRLMHMVPDEARGEGKAFRDIPATADADAGADAERLSTLDRLLLLSGRDLNWRVSRDRA
jgi:uncharacterized protein (TIGR03086 family)